MCEESHERPELRVWCIEHGAEEEREHEQHQQYRGVPDDGAKGDDGDAYKWARWLHAVDLERLHEHVRDNHKDSHDDREDDLGEDNCTPSSSRNIAR